MGMNPRPRPICARSSWFLPKTNLAHSGRPPIPGLCGDDLAGRRIPVELHARARAPARPCSPWMRQRPGPASPGGGIQGALQTTPRSRLSYRLQQGRRTPFRSPSPANSRALSPDKNEKNGEENSKIWGVRAVINGRARQVVGFPASSAP
jgi:hypothetical protein